MRRLVGTSSGSALIERDGPYGSLTMYSQDGTETPRIYYGGRGELGDALAQRGVPRPEAEMVAREFWEYWDTHCADAYYREARATVLGAAAIAGLFAVAIGRRAVKGRARR